MVFIFWSYVRTLLLRIPEIVEMMVKVQPCLRNITSCLVDLKNSSQQSLKLRGSYILHDIQKPAFLLMKDQSKHTEWLPTGPLEKL